MLEWALIGGAAYLLHKYKVLRLDKLYTLCKHALNQVVVRLDAYERGGFVMYQGRLLCNNCVPSGVETQPVELETWYGDLETPTCAECGAPLYVLELHTEEEAKTRAYLLGRQGAIHAAQSMNIDRYDNREDFVEDVKNKVQRPSSPVGEAMLPSGMWLNPNLIDELYRRYEAGVRDGADLSWRLWQQAKTKIGTLKGDSHAGKAA